MLITNQIITIEQNFSNYHIIIRNEKCIEINTEQAYPKFRIQTNAEIQDTLKIITNLIPVLINAKLPQELDGKFLTKVLKYPEWQEKINYYTTEEIPARESPPIKSYKIRRYESSYPKLFLPDVKCQGKIYKEGIYQFIPVIKDNLEPINIFRGGDLKRINPKQIEVKKLGISQTNQWRYETNRWKKINFPIILSDPILSPKNHDWSKSVLSLPKGTSPTTVKKMFESTIPPSPVRELVLEQLDREFPEFWNQLSTETEKVIDLDNFERFQRLIQWNDSKIVIKKSGNKITVKSGKKILLI